MDMSPEILVGLLAFAGTALFGLLAWSLKRNLDTLENTIKKLEESVNKLADKQAMLEKDVAHALGKIQSDVNRLLRRKK
jgi:predicted XRE-type DNA-binding protein